MMERFIVPVQEKIPKKTQEGAAGVVPEPVAVSNQLKHSLSHYNAVVMKSVAVSAKFPDPEITMYLT